MTQSAQTHFIQATNNVLTRWQSKTQALSDDLLASLQPEYALILSYTQYGLRWAETRETAVALIEQIYPLIELYGRWEQWLTNVEKVITELENDKSLTMFKLVRCQSRLLFWTRQTDKAKRVNSQALIIASGLEDNRLYMAQTYLEMSMLHLQCQELAEARAYGEKSLGILEKMPDEIVLKATTLGILGHIALEQHRFEQAIVYLEQAIEYQATFLISIANLARMYNVLGVVHQNLGASELAEQQFEKASTLLEPTNNLIDKVRTQVNLGWFYYEQKNYSQAEQVFDRLVQGKTLWQLENTHLQASTMQNLGNSLVAMSRYREAEDYLTRSIELWSIGNDKINHANTLGTRGEARAKQRDKNGACKDFREALELVNAYPENKRAQTLAKRFTRQLIKQGCKL